MGISHEHLLAICPRLPSDYAEYGGTVVRWADDDGYYPDCSCGCRWAVWLEPPHSCDWCVCVRPDAPRCGLVTFEHMAGHGCFEPVDAGDPG